jgi:membrane-associated protease RseP (regulator of RpoE activity)
MRGRAAPMTGSSSPRIHEAAGPPGGWPSDGPSSEAGLRPGEVILGANRTRVNSVADLRNAIREYLVAANRITAPKSPVSPL